MLGTPKISLQTLSPGYNKHKHYNVTYFFVDPFLARAFSCCCTLASGEAAEDVMIMLS